MTVPQQGSFRDLKEILSELKLDDEEDAEVPDEVKQRTHMLCSKFLGGVWKLVKVEQLRMTRMRGGMSNMLFLCRLPDSHKPTCNEPDKVLLRVYFNPETESHLVAESVIFTLLSERHLGPKLYGIFNGGRLEEYIPSRPLSCVELGLPALSHKIAKRVARIHQLDVPIAKEPDYICEALERWLKALVDHVPNKLSVDINAPGGGKMTLTEPDIVKEIDYLRWMQQLSLTESGSRPFVLADRCPATIINGDAKLEKGPVPDSLTCEDLANELILLKQCIVHSGSPVVFCHNDLQEGNILLPKSSSGNIRSMSVTEETRFLAPSPQPEAPRLVVIDFEYASYNHRAFDFANHFCEWTIDYSYDKPPFYQIHWDRFPTLDQQWAFFRTYLTALGVSEPYEEIIDKMVHETNAFVAVTHFFWGVWALLQVELSPVEFGFAEYGRERLSLYFENKPKLLALKKESSMTFNMDLDPADKKT